MYKLLIVEDERWLREGMADYLDWSRYNIQIVGTASNGSEGLEMAENTIPDIIITDIRMPKLDGIGMSKKVREILPDVKIVILTGYDDFKYAQEAIGFQATGYVLKPVVENEFVALIERITGELDEQHIKKEKTDYLNKQVEMSTELLKQKHFFDMFTGRIPVENAVHELENLGVTIAGIEFVLAGIYVEKCSNEMMPVYNWIRETIGELGVVMQSEMQDELYICLGWPEGDEYDLETFIYMIKDGIKDTFDTEISICVSENAKNVYELCKTYHEIKEVMDSLLMFDKGRIINCRNYLEQLNIKNAGVQDFIIHTNYFNKQIINGIKCRDTARVTSLLDDLFEFLNKSNCSDKNMVINVFSSILSETSFVLTTMNENIDEIYGSLKDLIKHLFSIRTFGELRSFISNTFFNIMTHIDSKQDSNENILVQKALEIVKYRYSENISLKTIAGELFISPYYLGYMFKKNVGKTFNDYLLGARMEKALELLGNPKYKVQKIACMVGIQNQSYFGSLFKKYFGISPGEYKENSLNICEGYISLNKKI